MPAEKRILISYFFGPNRIPLGDSCARALEELGYEVNRFDSGICSPLYSWLLKPLSKIIRALTLKRLELFKNFNHRFRERKLEQRVADYKPDILFVIRGHGFDPEFLRQLKKKHGIKTLIGWWVKGPKWFDLMKTEALAFDAYFCIHHENYTEQDHIQHLPALGVDTTLYNPGEGAQQFEHEVVFVGSWNPRRQAIIEQLGDLPLEIYGPGWLKRNLFNPAIRRMIKPNGIWGEELAQLYRSSKIVLNISSWEPSDTTAFNLRLFDVPATGAFLLTEDTKNLRQYFDPGQEIATFLGPHDLKEKVLYFLSNAEQRKEIALKGLNKVRTFETYHDKMNFL